MWASAIRVGCALILGAGLSACGDPDAASSDPTASPLAELMGWDQQYNEVEARAQQLEQEEAVAACMREEGFEYTPVDYSAQQGPQVVDDAAELYNDPKAFGEKYGYGVVHNYELWEEPNFNAEGELSYPGDEGFEDPNWEYQQTLSQSEQQAYQETLYGDQSMYEQSAMVEGSEGEFIEPTVMTMPPLEEQGCYGKAQLEVYGEQPFQDPDIQERMNEFYENQQNDPELEAALEDWLTCMVDELGDLNDMVDNDGIDPALATIDKPESMYSYVDLLKQLASGLELYPIDPDTGEPIGDVDTSMGYSSSMNENGTGWAAVGTQKPISESDLEALRQRELDLWKVDFGCQEDVDIAGIRKRSEQRLVDELIADFPELTETADK